MLHRVNTSRLPVLAETTIKSSNKLWMETPSYEVDEDCLPYFNLFENLKNLGAEKYGSVKLFSKTYNLSGNTEV
jgi:hypothetical protein